MRKDRVFSSLKSTADNRTEAIQTGSRYNSTEPCRNGHTGQRYASGVCVSCRSERNRRELQQTKRPSKMLDIDHLLAQRAEEALLDPYYDMEL